MDRAQGSLVDDSGGAQAADASAVAPRGNPAGARPGPSASPAPVRPGAIRVRAATERDREAARRILKQHHALSEFRDEPFSDAKLDRIADAALKRPPRRLALVAERAVQRQALDEGGGESQIDWVVVGLAAAGADPYMLSEGRCS